MSQSQIPFPYLVLYRGVNSEKGAISTVQGQYRTQHEAELGASTFLNQYPNGYNVFIAKAWLSVAYERLPLIKQELDID